MARLFLFYFLQGEINPPRIAESKCLKFSPLQMILQAEGYLKIFFGFECNLQVSLKDDVPFVCARRPGSLPGKDRKMSRKT